MLTQAWGVLGDATESWLTVSRFAVGGLFVWFASMKLGDPTVFWRQVMAYRILGARGSRAFASFVPPLEFIFGLFFASGVLPLASGGVLVSLLAIFSAALVSSLVRNLENECGCGTNRTRVRPILLLRNAAIAAALVGGMFSPPVEYPGELPILGIGGLLIVVIAANRFKTLGK